MNRLIVLTLLVFSACGQPYIDPRAQQYVNEWNNMYPNNQVNVPVEFRDLNSGTCEGIAGVWNGEQVLLDNTLWSQCGIWSTDPAHQQLVFHELGHGVLNLLHDFDCISTTDDTVIPNCDGYFDPSVPVQDFGYVPRSIMFPYMFGDATFYSQTIFQQYYFSQLLTCTTCTNPTNGSGDSVDRLQTGRKLIRMD